MSSQRERARSAGKFILNLDEGEWVLVSEGESSKFLGYESLESESKIRRYRKNDNQIEIILDQTPFYAESGGQVGDTGIFSCNDFSFEVSDTIKQQNEFIHVGQIKSGSIENIKVIHASVTGSRREKIRLNHTATHLLHQALKDVLGAHVQQAGSLVTADKLRFDLTHYERMSEENLQKIEMLVNLVIRENHQVDTKVMNFDDAKESGAIALFGEKYEDDVRVVNIEGFSKELCGGTHVSRTGDIGIFKIISETALSSGVRRIEAVTGAAVSKLLSKNDTLISDVKHLLKCADSEIIERLESVVNEKKILEREIKKINQSSQGSVVEDLVASAEIINGYKIVVEQLDNVSDFKEMGDSFRQHFKNRGVALIGTKVSQKPMVMCAVSDDLTTKLKAGDIVRSVGQIMGGGGGGKPHLATAGGKDISKLEEALESGKKLIIEKLGNNE
jgi:alanyl-tRNA synthetase